nr:copper resistance CopC family protein [Actinocrispum wychmicini]
MRRIAAVAVLAGLAFAGLASPALAHNALVGSDPKDQASLDVGPQTVRLTFDQPVQDDAGANTVAVIGPSGDHWETAAPKVDSNVVSATVGALGPSGQYSVNWRVLSADGHPVQGTVKFTLAKAGNGTPTPPDVLAKFGGTGLQSGDSGGGIPTWVWIVGAAVLLVIGVVFAMRMGGKEDDA